MNRDYMIAMIAGFPSVMLGLLAYRRSLHVDSVAAQAGIATESRAGTAQIMEGLNSIIDNLQEDNKAAREQIRFLEKRYADMEKKCVELRRQFNALQRKYGENGAT